MTDDVLGYKSDLKHTSTAKERGEDREKNTIEGLRFIEDELRVVKEEFQAAREELCTKAVVLDRARQEAFELIAPWSAWPRSATRYAETTKGGRL